MPKLTNEIPHVAILLESPYPTHTQILRGILRFMKSQIEDAESTVSKASDLL